ncbi:MAG: hypothetical protein JWN95_3903 [Frankiales bacterium]|nr:hypothetical protein [Frankiales bacterium]
MPAASGTLTARRLGLDGAVYASPVVVGGTIIVATEHNTLYGFSPTGTQRWRMNFGTPTPPSALACGNIEPIGITGTPVWDPATGTVFAVASTGTSVVQTLVGLDPATGKLRFRRQLAFPGVDPNAMQQRGALAVTAGKVWIPFGARAGDCGDYKGRVVGVATNGAGTQVDFTPETKRGGGIWNPMGVVVNRQGRLLAVSANGAAFPGDSYDHTNTLLELDVTAGTPRLVDSFAPSDWALNNQQDVGLGSQSPALIGDRWIFLGGKSMSSYVLAQGRLGGIGGEVSQGQFCRSFGGTAVRGSTVYVPCTDGVRAVNITRDGKPVVAWHADGAIAGAPVVGGGRVYALDQDGGVLHALDPGTGQTKEQVAVGVTSRFATPAITGSRVIVPTMAGITIVDT